MWLQLGDVRGRRRPSRNLSQLGGWLAARRAGSPQPRTTLFATISRVIWLLCPPFFRSEEKRAGLCMAPKGQETTTSGVKGEADWAKAAKNGHESPKQSQAQL